LEPTVLFDSFPNAVVDIYITVLQNDGGILAAAITAASLALIQAGIDVKDSVVACTAVR